MSLDRIDTQVLNNEIDLLLENVILKEVLQQLEEEAVESMISCESGPKGDDDRRTWAADVRAVRNIRNKIAELKVIPDVRGSKA